MSQISFLVLQRMKTVLSARMNIGLSKADPRYVTLFKLGRFQSDPTDGKYAVHLAFTLGDPKMPELTDGIFGLAGGESRQEDTGLWFPAYEIGPDDDTGRAHRTWVRRGRVDIGCYYTTQNFKEDAAMDAATSVLGKATYELGKVRVSDLIDAYNERGILLDVFGSNFFESGGSGGDPNQGGQWVWRGTIKWQVFTERP